MNISIYYGGCWSTNVGNAFIDYGAMHTCKDHNPVIYSEYDYLVFGNKRSNYLNTFADLKPKCIIFSGMVTCRQFTIDQKEIFDIIDAHNIPVVLNGVGGENFSRGEVNTFRDFIKSHKFAGFISRDDQSYDAYHDLFPQSYRGIDVAFFLSEIDGFKFLNDVPKKYMVINEDDLGFNKNPKDFPEYKQAVQDGSIVYTHHQLTNMPPSYISTPKMMLSEMPSQYLYLYAMSNMTFTTRVHACIATLSFGGKCILLYNTPRASLFSRVGCGDITSKPCVINKDLLESRKGEHRAALNSILGGLN